jgi:hypothetical protein
MDEDYDNYEMRAFDRQVQPYIDEQERINRIVDSGLAWLEWPTYRFEIMDLSE